MRRSAVMFWVLLRRFGGIFLFFFFRLPNLAENFSRLKCIVEEVVFLRFSSGKTNSVRLVLLAFIIWLSYSCVKGGAFWNNVGLRNTQWSLDFTLEVFIAREHGIQTKRLPSQFFPHYFLPSSISWHLGFRLVKLTFVLPSPREHIFLGK